jgi:hypothetical protein
MPHVSPKDKRRLFLILARSSCTIKASLITVTGLSTVQIPQSLISKGANPKPYMTSPVPLRLRLSSHFNHNPRNEIHHHPLTLSHRVPPKQLSNLIRMPLQALLLHEFEHELRVIRSRKRFLVKLFHGRVM